MPEQQAAEEIRMSVTTPIGAIDSSVTVPSGFVPITSIVPVMHAVGERTQALEVDQAAAAGHMVSCQRGCAACCRMLVPVSPPEAFALQKKIAQLPAEQQQRIRARMEEAKARLAETRLLPQLNQVAETSRQLDDAAMDAVNQAYYALRLPCPFLENEECSIYDDRPAACRELLVTSPPDLCQDLAMNPVQSIPIPVRMGTALAMLWSQLHGGPARLIPLPVALDWADRHATEQGHTWKAMPLLEQTLQLVQWCLDQEFRSRKQEPGEASPEDPQAPDPAQAE